MSCETREISKVIVNEENVEKSKKLVEIDNYRLERRSASVEIFFGVMFTDDHECFLPDHIRKSLEEQKPISYSDRLFEPIFSYGLVGLGVVLFKTDWDDIFQEQELDLVKINDHCKLLRPVICNAFEDWGIKSDPKVYCIPDYR